MMRIVSLLSLLWSLVEVHSQSFPRLSFMSQTLANNSYVDLSQVGNDFSGSDGVQCLTDLSSCCTGTQGPVHRGDWYFPDGDRLPFNGDNVGFFEFRVSQGVDIRLWNNANSPTVGIYRCYIPTIAIHDDTDASVRDTVYVGLYTASGGMLLEVLIISYFHFLLDIWIAKEHDCIYDSPHMHGLFQQTHSLTYSYYVSLIRN